MILLKILLAILGAFLIGMWVGENSKDLAIKELTESINKLTYSLEQWQTE